MTVLARRKKVFRCYILSFCVSSAQKMLLMQPSPRLGIRYCHVYFTLQHQKSLYFKQKEYFHMYNINTDERPRKEKGQRNLYLQEKKRGNNTCQRTNEISVVFTSFDLYVKYYRTPTLSVTLGCQSLCDQLQKIFKTQVHQWCYLQLYTDHLRRKKERTCWYAQSPFI